VEALCPGICHLRNLIYNFNGKSLLEIKIYKSIKEKKEGIVEGIKKYSFPNSRGLST
jgi:hypothetical protein